PVHGGRVAQAGALQHGARRDADPHPVGVGLDGLDGAELLHDPGEHQAWSSRGAAGTALLAPDSTALAIASGARTEGFVAAVGASSRRRSAPTWRTDRSSPRHTSSMVAAPGPANRPRASSPPNSAGAR